MSGPVTIRVEGLDRVAARLKAHNLLGPALRKGLDSAGFMLASEAKKLAPVDRGTLRASIAHEVDPAETPQWVRIGAKPFYAPYMEYGTGLVHDHPSWPRKRHVPPAEALAGWGQRKGVDGADVASAIAKRGGLKPRRYLRGALEANEQRAVKIVSGALKTMEKELGA